jgi:methyl-accepting chemotaxis protein
MGKKTVKQSTIIFIMGSITLLLSMGSLVLSILVKKSYNDVLSAYDIKAVLENSRLNDFIIFIMILIVLITAFIITSIVLLHTKVIKRINRLKDAMTAIADGDLSYSINTPVNTSEIGQLSGLILKTRDILNTLVIDTVKVHSAAAEGKLDVRAVVSRYKGSYRQIIDETNNAMDVISVSVNESEKVLNSIANNDLSAGMEGEYSGQFLELSKAVNDVRHRLLNIEKVFMKVSQGDTSQLEEFTKIGKRSDNDNLIPSAINMMQAIRGLINEVNNITKECMNGNIKNARGNTAGFIGGYQEIINGINNIIEAVDEPVNEAVQILKVMALNDFTSTMSNKYKGEFSILANSINEVQTRLLVAQNVAVKVSQGDISELDNFRKIGRRSENDHLVPAFINMMESIQSLIDETKTLAHAAAEGDLHTRGDAGKFRGEYINIISGINDIINSAATPIQEVKNVMLQISQGNLNTSVKGSYKGDYSILTNSVNETAVILKNVVSEISNILLRITQNDLNIEKVRAYKGDFALISDSLNEIVDSLCRTMREINTAAEQVAAGAEQIASASQLLSQGSEEQASSIEEVTASITDMASQVKHNALNATQADDLSLAAKSNAVKGNDQMREMLQAMHEINESSTNISKIIKVIDDIAFQTNILALNAAVEAARAGQYGKGFAVVAEEVRNLAQRSASAAEETTAMIEGSISKVDTGTKIANNTALALNEIVESITKAAELVNQIASASNEQASAISQVNQAVEEVSQVVQTNSATAEESASASEELSSQAEMLTQMVNKFKLKAESDMGIPNFDKLSPDIINVIEELIEKRDKAQGYGQKNNELHNRNTGINENQAYTSADKPYITLDDKDYDKY